MVKFKKFIIFTGLTLFLALFTAGPLIFRSLSRPAPDFDALKNQARANVFNPANPHTLKSDGLFYDDLAHQYFPDALALAKTLQSLNIPMRRPGIFAGSSTFYRSGDIFSFYFPLYPFLLAAPLDNLYFSYIFVFILPLIFHLVIGFYGFFRLLKKGLSLSGTAAAWGAFLYILSPGMAFSITSLNQTFMLCLLPWALVFTLEFAGLHKKSSLIYAGLTSGLIVLTGDYNYIWRAVLLLVFLVPLFTFTIHRNQARKMGIKLFFFLLLIPLTALVVSSPSIYGAACAYKDLTVNTVNIDDNINKDGTNKDLNTGLKELLKPFPVITARLFMVKSILSPLLTGYAGITEPTKESGLIINNDGNISGGILFSFFLFTGFLLALKSIIDSPREHIKIDPSIEHSPLPDLQAYFSLILLAGLFFYFMTGPFKQGSIFQSSIFQSSIFQSSSLSFLSTHHPVYFSFALNFILIIIAAFSIQFVLSRQGNNKIINNKIIYNKLINILIYLLLLCSLGEALFYAWFFYHKTPVQPLLHKKNISARLFHQRYSSVLTHPVYNDLKKIAAHLKDSTQIEAGPKILTIPSNLSKPAEALGFRDLAGYDSKYLSPKLKYLLKPYFLGWPYTLTPRAIPKILLSNLGIDYAITRQGLFDSPQIPLNIKPLDKRYFYDFGLDKSIRQIESDNFISGPGIEIKRISENIDNKTIFLYPLNLLQARDEKTCLMGNIDYLMETRLFCLKKDLPLNSDNILENTPYNKASLPLITNVSGLEKGNTIQVILARDNKKHSFNANNAESDSNTIAKNLKNRALMLLKEVVPGGKNHWKAYALNRGKYQKRKVFLVNALFPALVIQPGDTEIKLVFKDPVVQFLFMLSLAFILGMLFLIIKIKRTYKK
jgi:hypothetical protein